MLKVRGNRLVDGGREVILRGVNCAGLEWDSSYEQLERVVSAAEAALELWKANCLRIPVCQDRWFGFAPEQRSGDRNYFAAYREAVDRIVEEAGSRGAYVILDMHWSDAGVWGERIGQHFMPDKNTVAFWNDAALRYKNCGNVLFNLYNEPHDASWDVWKNGGSVEEDGVRYDAVGMDELVCVIREVGAENVIVCGGLDWAYSFEGMAESVGGLDEENLIYDCHIYPWKRLEWERDVCVVDRVRPVIVSEFGHYGDDANPREGRQCLPAGEWLERLFGFVNGHGYSWLAWDFHPAAGPCLIKGYSYEPTEWFGVRVKQELEKAAQWD